MGLAEYVRSQIRYCSLTCPLLEINEPIIADKNASVFTVEELTRHMRELDAPLEHFVTA